MTREEYVEMIEYVEDRWGVSSVWQGAVRLYTDFEDLDTDQVYEVLLGRQSGDPEKARYAPKPAELIALTRERMRHAPPPPRGGLPEATETYNWAEHSQRMYGEVITLDEAVLRRHEELVAAGPQRWPVI